MGAQAQTQTQTQTQMGQVYVPETCAYLTPVYTEPITPCVAVLGLGESCLPPHMFQGERHALLVRRFKDTVLQTCQNLLTVTFEVPILTAGRHGSVPRSHLVREEWMLKMRYWKPSVVVTVCYPDSGYADLERDLGGSRSTTHGSSRIVWCLGSKLGDWLNCSQIARWAQVDRSSVFVFDLDCEQEGQVDVLKAFAQRCIDVCGSVYREWERKYRRLLSGREESRSQRFESPWMPQVHYFFKLAVIDELKGDFEPALKCYHSVLAIFKQLIEERLADRDQRAGLTAFLRPCADICFIRLSYILFRMNQATEAEFGLFRYLTYFQEGLKTGQVFLWKHSVSRLFVRQLERAAVWNPRLEAIMRGRAHFLMYSSRWALKHLAGSASGPDVYPLQEALMNDLVASISACSDRLWHSRIFLLAHLFERYFQFEAYEQIEHFAPSLREAVDRRLLWPQMAKEAVAILTQASEKRGDLNAAVLDTWRGSFLRDAVDIDVLSRYGALMKDAALQPPLLNFASLPNPFLYCSVSFRQRSVQVGRPLEFELIFFNASNCMLRPESIGVFFDDASCEAHVVALEDDDVFRPCSTKVFLCSFEPKRAAPSGIRIDYVTMHLGVPSCISAQYDSTTFVSSDNLPLNAWQLADKSADGWKFVKRASSILRQDLVCVIEPIKPSVDASLKLLSEPLANVPVPALLTVANTSPSRIAVELEFGPNEVLLLDEALLPLAPSLYLGCIDSGDVTELALNVQALTAGSLSVTIKSSFDFESVSVERASTLGLQPLVAEKQFMVSPLNPFQLHVMPVLNSTRTAETERSSIDPELFLQFKSAHDLHIVNLQVYDASNVAVLSSKRCGSDNRFFVSLGLSREFGEELFHVKAGWRIGTGAEQQSCLSFSCDLRPF